MTNLYLHIGSHKTGTSALQQFLYKNRQILGPLGLHDLRVTPSESMNNGGIIGVPYGYERDNFISEGALISRRAAPRIIRAVSQKCYSKADLGFVFSSENFSWVFQEEEIQKFIDALSGYFLNIQVVFYCRRQDKMLRAHHRQGVIDPLPRLFYGTEMGPDITFQDHFDKYLDYGSRISAWAKAVGEQNVQVRVFEREQLLHKDISFDFLNAIGLRDFPEGLCRPSSSANTFSRKQERVLRLFQDLVASDEFNFGKENEKAMKNKLRQHLRNKNDQSSEQLSPEFSSFILERYRDSNHALSSRFGLGHDWYEKENEPDFNPPISNYEFNSTVKILLKSLLRSELEGRGA